MMEYEQASYRFYRIITFSLLNNKLSKTEALELIGKTHNQALARKMTAEKLEEKFFEGVKK